MKITVIHNSLETYSTFIAFKKESVISAGERFIMLNNRKIRLMTKLAIYEEKEGKEDIKMSKYYKSDYVRYHMLKNIVSVTVAYILILVMIIVYNLELIVRDAVNLDYKRYGVYALGFYVLILSIYITGSIIGYSMKYDSSRKKLGRYYKMLRKLSRMYEEETRE